MRLRATAATLLTLGLGMTTALLPATPAAAEARVTVANEQGRAQADSTYATPLTVSGTGFQSVKGGFGGVYVMFGWVDDAAGGGWKPSRGGLTGEDYRYVPDSESASNLGYQRFVAFPGSDTADSANGGTLTAAGSFTVELTVPGPVFDSQDRNGSVSTVDCRKVTCGVITIGAHGVKNAHNETFTPVTFTDVFDAATEDDTSDEKGADGKPGSTATADPVVPERTGKPTVAVDRATAVAGRVLAFTGSGFLPGEQVLATFDDGVAAVGPLVAGQSGEVAAVLQLPDDVSVGTHTLRLRGAASKVSPTLRFPVAAGGSDAEATTAVTPRDGPASGGRGVLASSPVATGFLVVSALVLLGAVLLTVVRLRRRRVGNALA